MNAICDICGKSSQNDKICTNCGAKIFSDEEISVMPSNLTWGWAVFDFAELDFVARQKITDRLRDKWKQLEEFTILRLVESQLSLFSLNSPFIKVVVREDDFLSLKRTLASIEGWSAQFTPVASLEDPHDISALVKTAAAQ